MPSIVVGTGPTVCVPGRWTAVWDSPTLGFTYLWSDRPVTVQWRRFASGAPPYWQGSINLNTGKNVLWHGGPATYMHLEVNPTAMPAVIRAT